jgi:hypothetical protein
VDIACHCFFSNIKKSAMFFFLIFFVIRKRAKMTWSELQFNNQVLIGVFDGHFVGRVFKTVEEFQCQRPNLPRRLCVYISNQLASSFEHDEFTSVFVIKDGADLEAVSLQTTLESSPDHEMAQQDTLHELKAPDPKVIDVGEVPVSVHGLGILFRRCFGNMGSDVFEAFSTAHQFQSLTLGNNKAMATRSGVYTTPVRQTDQGIEFSLLRCSSNFTGPTENFRDIDVRVVHKVQELAAPLFKKPIVLNHILAQVYTNTVNVDADGKRSEQKAVIAQHSDKTKDMPIEHTAIAFCTFYENWLAPKFKHLKHALQQSKSDAFDIVHKGNVSVLTTLRFRLKQGAENHGNKLPNEFQVVLYPDSCFVIPMSTNRLYTHEIVPSILPVELIPTRMSLVIRGSKRKAVFRDGKTFLIQKQDKLQELQPPTPTEVARLKKLYAQENATDDIIEYGDDFVFSMNAGDYTKPTL